ncbi:hypothetical protein PMIN04_013096 [Paraphaeosphaeria minitans]
MILHEHLSTSQPLQELVAKMARLIETEDSIKQITERRMRPGIATSTESDVFKFEWNPALQALAIELARILQSTITKKTLANAGLSIRDPQPQETGLTQQVLLTNEAMFTSNRNQGFLVVRLPISHDAHRGIIHHIQTCIPRLNKTQLSESTDPELQLRNDKDHSEREKIKLVTDGVSLIYPGVGFRTEPPFIPVLVIPFPLQKTHHGDGEL